MVGDDEDSIPFSAKSGDRSSDKATSRSPVEQNEAERRVNAAGTDKRELRL
jgi:hypothetical protein